MRRKIIMGGIIVFIALIVCFFREYITVKPPLKLIGTYQSETDPPNIIMLSFFQNGTFEEYYNASLVDSGTYLKEVDIVYTLHSDKKDEYIVLQDDDSFYYFYEVPKGLDIYLLKNLGKVPTRILTECYYSN